MVNLGFDHALAQWCTTAGGGGSKAARSLKRRADSAGAEARKAARSQDAAEQAARDAENKQRQAAAFVKLQERAANPAEVLTKFCRWSGLKSDDLKAIKDDECLELDPNNYFLRNDGGVPISLMPGGALYDSAWRTPGDSEPVEDMAEVDAPDPSTEATRGGYYVDIRRDIHNYDVDGYLTKVESPGIDLFAYMWMYMGNGVFYRELTENVPGGGRRRVKFSVRNWMVKDAAAETALQHRMCYFTYKHV